MSKRVAILISGSGSNMVSLIKGMKVQDVADPVIVLSNRPDAPGLKRAQSLGVMTAVVDHKKFATREKFENELIDTLDHFQPDIVCLAGFMRILTSGFIAHYQDRILNVHPSLLPRYKGLKTHERALAAGETHHGCSVHLVTPLLDDGPVLGQARVPILSGDTPQTLAARVLEMEHKLYPAVLNRFAMGNHTLLNMP